MPPEQQFDNQGRQASDLVSGRLNYSGYKSNYIQQMMAVEETISKTVDGIDETTEAKAAGALNALGMVRIWLIGLVVGTAYKIAAA